MDFKDPVLAEYQLVHANRSTTLQVMEARLNAFLLIIGGYIALVAALIQNAANFAPENLVAGKGEFFYLIPFAILVTSLTIVLIGVITFQRMIKRHIEIVFASGIIDKMRRKIAESDPNLIGYFPLTALAPKSKLSCSVGYSFDKKSRYFSLPTIIALLNSLIVAICVGVLIRIKIGGNAPTIHVFWGVLAFASVCIWHFQVQKKAFMAAKKEFRAFFKKLG